MSTNETIWIPPEETVPVPTGGIGVLLRSDIGLGMSLYPLNDMRHYHSYDEFSSQEEGGILREKAYQVLLIFTRDDSTEQWQLFYDETNWPQSEELARGWAAEAWNEFSLSPQLRVGGRAGQLGGRLRIRQFPKRLLEARGYRIDETEASLGKKLDAIREQGVPLERARRILLRGRPDAIGQPPMYWYTLFFIEPETIPEKCATALNKEEEWWYPWCHWFYNC